MRVMKKNIVKLAVLLSLTIIMLLLAGCVDIKYSNIMTGQGEVIRKAIITIDKDMPNKEQAYRYAEEKAKAFVERQTSAFSLNADLESFTVVITEHYADMQEYYLAYGITGDEIEEDSSVIINDGLYSESIDESPIIFARSDMQDLIEQIEQEINALFGINSKNYSLTYEYGTPYKSVTSNADSVVYEDGVYKHTWITNGEEYKQKSIRVTYRSPNSTWWYTIAIAAAVVVLVTLLIVKQRKVKTDGQKTEQE